MATDTGDGFSPHLRGVTVTTVATLAGMAAGVASALVTGDPKDTIGLAIVVVTIGAQFPIFKLLGVDVDGFSKKDYLYVAFMTFALWFITWGILLTAGTLQ